MRSRIDRGWETRQLPENPASLTFRGRYIHVDKRLCELLKLKEHAGESVRVLDVGCGILPFGSPTLHDLHDALTEYEVRPMLFGVDRHMPLELKPSYADIRYDTSFNKLEGKFDVVRLLHVLEHMAPWEYHRLRTRLLRRLRVGGIFVATQRLQYYRPLPKDEWYLLHPSVKIAQKTKRGIKAIELLPELLLPMWMRGDWGMSEEQFLKCYAEHRDDVANGKEVLKLKMFHEGHRPVLNWLTTLVPTILETESFEELDLPMWDSLGPDRALSEYFADPTTVAAKFWSV